ncbi:zinc finger protein 883-like [Chrysoperla carnea]|uniref:zinc finger protein 883-like n=1 Tax=Chrysoperla carnea TaxID=189513 RepID=UPI001D08D71E|nr:zinc finger protein 883-like [Chrysoperla carnea]
MEEIITDEIIDIPPIESETILIKSETNDLKIDESDVLASEEMQEDEDIDLDEEAEDDEEILNDGSAEITDVKMIECPVCRLNVISFMMEEHKNTCSGADETILGTADNYSIENDDDLDEEDRKDISLNTETDENGENDGEDGDGDENKIYKCPNQGCVKVYKKKFYLSRHLKHTNCTGTQVKYECKVCGRAYSRPDNLRAHLKSAHVDNKLVVKDKSVACPHCDKVLKNKAILLVHMRIHTGEKPYQCDVCPKAFPTSGAYQKHKRVHTGERPFMCPQCKRRFTAKEVLNRHMKTHSAVKPHVCMFCNKSFVQAMQLRAHMFHHTGEYSCICKTCGAAFSKQNALTLHVKYEHEGAKPLECEVCKKTFLTKNFLVRHQIIHSGVKEHECPNCKKRFISKPALKTHMLTHTGEKPYECKECHAKFAAKETLNRHVRTHTNNKPHECNFCGRRFIQLVQLRAHLFYHTGQFGYECEHCGKTFNRRLRLTIHMKYVHEGEPPMKCTHCDKTFIRKEDLARHTMIHTGRKDHECPQCKKRFYSKSSLKFHLLTHRKEEPRICHDCGRAFIRLDCLIRHLRAKHRDEFDNVLSSIEKEKLRGYIMNINDEKSEKTDIKFEYIEDMYIKNLQKLLLMLIEHSTLQQFGWPDEPIDKILDSLIIRCGSVPVVDDNLEYIDRLRENTKLLFAVILNDNFLESLLNNKSVDEVIEHILRLAGDSDEKIEDILA